MIALEFDFNWFYYSSYISNKLNILAAAIIQLLISGKYDDIQPNNIEI